VVRGLERIASSELRIAAARSPAAVDLAEAIEELRIVIQPSFQDDGLIVIWEIAPGLPQVWADNRSLLQILTNVARSSHRAMLDQEIGELTVTASMEPDHVAVRFCHAGRGVPLLERLFQPFRNGAGESGLELYVSRVMAQSFGGDLLYEPQRKGSCLAVKLTPAYETTEESDEANSHSSSR
jgi:signal transduction histidine kinase